MANRNNTTTTTTAPKSLTRREAGGLAIIGAIAAAAGSAVNASAAAAALAPAFDPIFAAVENHRSAFLRSSEACRAMQKLEQPGARQSPVYIEAQEANDAAQDVTKNAALALTNIRPTTLTGVIALLAYVDEFNRGGVALDAAHGWASERILWPDTLIHDGRNGPRGQQIKLPFAFWLLHNVQASLQSIAGQA